MSAQPGVSSVCFRLRIPVISKLDEVWSPEFVVQGAPWKFLVKKTLCDDKHYLGVYVYCEREDKQADWSYAAALSFKLLTFGEGRTELEEHVNAFVFDRVESGFGGTSFITWEDLFNVHKHYVRDDTVNLELKIDVADPFEETRSKLKFVRQSDNKFRLVVSNINNLMATRTPIFVIQKLPFNLVVCKSHLTNLGIYLYQRGATCDISSIITMSAKLISSNNLSTIEKSSTDTVEHGTLHIDGLISWDTLFDSRLGFVNNNDVVIEVELVWH